jgi:hypothetical protein
VISTPANDPESGGEAEYTERPASATIKQHSERGQTEHAADTDGSRITYPNEDRKPS